MQYGSSRITLQASCCTCLFSTAHPAVPPSELPLLINTPERSPAKVLVPWVGCEGFGQPGGIPKCRISTRPSAGKRGPKVALVQFPRPGGVDNSNIDTLPSGAVIKTPCAGREQIWWKHASTIPLGLWSI